jgi:hypothetical protein
MARYAALLAPGKARADGASQMRRILLVDLTFTYRPDARTDVMNIGDVLVGGLGSTDRNLDLDGATRSGVY